MANRHDIWHAIPPHDPYQIIGFGGGHGQTPYKSIGSMLLHRDCGWWWWSKFVPFFFASAQDLSARGESVDAWHGMIDGMIYGMVYPPTIPIK